jgi:signal transduction histidine kinase
MTMTRLSHASSTHDGQPADHSCAPLLSAFESVLHDLRTPLTAIQAQTQLLQRLRAGSGDETSRLPVGLLRIEDASRRLERCLFGLNHVHHRVDQCQMRERLRIIAQVSPSFRIDLFRVQTERARE